MNRIRRATTSDVNVMLVSRSFYVGDAVSEEDIHAKYEDGILKLSVPKKAPKAVEEKDGYIAIEG